MLKHIVLDRLLHLSWIFLRSQEHFKTKQPPFLASFRERSGILTIIELSVVLLKNILKTGNDSGLHCNWIICLFNFCSSCMIIYIGRFPLPHIVHFRSACRGTEIYLRELTLLNTLSSNPKSSRFVDLAFSYKLLFYLH